MTDDKLDRIYRDYFRHVAPAELPPLVRSELQSNRAGGQSRFILAASVAALLGLGLLVSQLQSPRSAARGSAAPLPADVTADGELLKPKINQNP